MTGYATSYLTGSPWLGVLVAGIVGSLLGALHAGICSLPKVNDIAVGIALMLFGTGAAFFLGTPFVAPQAPHLPSISLGFWSSIPQIQAALQVNALFFIGVLAAPLAGLGAAQHRHRPDAADGGRQRRSRPRRRLFAADGAGLWATCFGGFMAGVGGSFLSLYYPGSWSEGLSSGQGIIAVALVIFARWRPMACLWASLLFGGAGALGPALQSVGVSGFYYLFNAAPYILTLAIMIIACSPDRTLAGAPGRTFHH